MKVAIVHDWLVGMRGGEKVLEAFCEIFPEADIHTLVCDKEKLSNSIAKMKIHTSFLQKLPFAIAKYSYYLPVMPFFVENFDLSNYDLVISLSHCVAKSCKTSGPHICYCFTPMRYAYDRFGDYFGKNLIYKLLFYFLKKWDIKTSSRPDSYLTLSKYVQNRIKHFYGRDSFLIYPFVDTDFYEIDRDVQKEDFFLIVSALVPYKRVDLAVKTFNKSGKELRIIGEGPCEGKLRKIAKSNIKFLGYLTNESLRKHYQGAKALIFPGVEDFGIVPLEAQACGTCVIAFAKGGVLETVVNGKTGCFFHEQNEKSLLHAIDLFESMSFDCENCRNNALLFTKEKFVYKIKTFIDLKYNGWQESH